MFMKGLYMAVAGVALSGLAFLAPSGLTASEASPEKVSKQSVQSRPGGGPSRGRYIFIGGYHRGK